MRRNKTLGTIILILFVLFYIYDTYQALKYEYELQKLHESTENDSKEIIFDEKLEIHFVDINQGDCTVIKVGDNAMIIDAGNNGYGSKVRRYIETLGIKKLDYVIGTHPDADHIGGLDVVIYNFECGMVFMPECSKDTKTYDDVIQTCKNKNYKINAPKVGEVYELGDARFTILAPLHYDYDGNYNDCSIAIMLEYGDNRFLFTGDCEEAAEADLIESSVVLDADLFKVAHHGSNTANTQEFLDSVTPDYCVISCGEGNTYGHPHGEVLNNLRAMGVKVFRTDEQGTIVAYSDGKNITFNMSPSESWKAGN